MSRARPRRIFLGLTEIAGYYSSVAASLEQLGHQADVVTLAPHPFGYATSASAPARRAERWARAMVDAGARFGPVRLLAEGLARVGLMVWALIRYDAFVFGFRNSFLVGWELPLFRLFGKPVVSVFHGSDHRPPYLDGVVASGRSSYELVRRTASVKRLVRRFERGSTVVVGNPLSAQLHERPLVTFQAIGTLALDTAGPAPAPPSSGDRLRLLHAPSVPAAKGTPLIREAVQQLRDEGVDVELVEITGRPNAEVLAALAACHLVVDQLYSDTFLAGFAAEAAAAGRAAVVGGYGFDELERALPAALVPPGYRCRPDELLDTLRRLATDHNDITRTGAAARSFVADGMSAPMVAERFVRLLDGDVPDEWRFDPADSDYLLGACLPEQEVDRIGREIVARHGLSALRIDDKPRLLELARQRFE